MSGRRPLREAGELGRSERASIRVERRIEWVDTDASAHWHNTAAIRVLESAESVLHERLGILDLIYSEGGLPRVHMEVDYWKPIRYNEIAEIVLEVAALGRTSITYDAAVSRRGEFCARMQVVAVLRRCAGPQPWPEKIRQLLLTAGPQRPQFLD